MANSPECIPVSVRYPNFAEYEPHLAGMFEGMMIPSSDAECTNHELCNGCHHNYQMGDSLLELLESGAEPNGNAIQNLIVEPAQLAQYALMLTKLSLAPRELGLVLDDNPVVKAIANSVSKIRRREWKSRVDDDVDLHPLAVFNIAMTVRSTKPYSSERDLYVYLTSLSEKNVRRIFERLEEREREILSEYFFGELPYTATQVHRKKHIKELMNVPSNVVSYALEEFKWAIETMLEGYAPTDFSAIEFDHRLLRHIKGTNCAVLVGAHKYMADLPGYTASDWLEFARSGGMLNSSMHAERLRAFMDAVDQTVDSSKDS